MTDEIAALGALAQTPGAAREAALETFTSRHANEPLVVDKWFALQAVIPETRYARADRAADEPSRLFARQPEPRALADRRLRDRQSDAVQCAPTAAALISSLTSCCTRREEPAGRGAAAWGVQKLARAGAEAARSGRGGAAPRRRPRRLSADVQDIVDRSLG